MPRPRYENLDPEKKKKLLDAATLEFAAHGFELASINTILDNAELSKGSFYYYFDDKADLALTLVAEITEESIVHLRQMQLPTTPDAFWVELRRMSVHRLHLLKTNRPRYEAMLRLAATLFKDVRLISRMPAVHEARRLMAAFMEQGVALGVIRSDLPVGTMLAIIEGLKTSAYQTMYPGDTVPTDEQIEAFGDLVIDFAKRITAK